MRDKVVNLAIQFAGVRVISTGNGSIVGLSSYIERGSGRDQISGQSYAFGSRSTDLLESGLVVPPDAPEWAFDREQLWNEASLREYVVDRKTGEHRLSKNGQPQVAKAYVLALPKELSLEQNTDLVRAYVAESFGLSGVAVQWAIHADHSGHDNIHAHLLVSTRRLGEKGFGVKARELNPQFSYSRVAGKGFITEEARVGSEWAAFQNRFFAARGLNLRVDPTRLVADAHQGKARSENSYVGEQRAALAERNREQARDPRKLVLHLTKREASFSLQQLDVVLAKSGLSEAEQRVSREAVLALTDLVVLEEQRRVRSGWVKVQRYSLNGVLAQEEAVLALGAQLAGQGGFEVAPGALEQVLAGRGLTAEQQAAFSHATGVSGLVIVQGRAGTGKSYTAGAIREAYQQSGFRVIGLAPTNTVAADMRADGFEEGRTLAAEMLRLEHGHAAWDHRTVVILDEMGMLSVPDLERLFRHAAQSGAKIIGFGDDRQLAAIERGGFFGPLAAKIGSVELKTVSRQRDDWQRQASELVAQGNFTSAVQSYEAHGALNWTETLEAAFGEVKARWIDAEALGSTPFVYATSNAAVERMNRELRAARIELGQISRAGEQVFATVKGALTTETTLSLGDRIQFNATVKDRSKGLELRNGEFGTVIGMEGSKLRVHLESGRIVQFDASEHKGWGLGYAGTTYKGQGKTNDSTILLYDSVLGWQARGAYVNLTRHRSKMQMVIPRELAASTAQLSRQMKRENSVKPAMSYKQLGAEEAARHLAGLRPEVVKATPVAASEVKLDVKPEVKPEVKLESKPTVPAPAPVTLPSLDDMAAYAKLVFQRDQAERLAHIQEQDRLRQLQRQAEQFAREQQWKAERAAELLQAKLQAEAEAQAKAALAAEALRATNAAPVLEPEAEPDQDEDDDDDNDYGWSPSFGM